MAGASKGWHIEELIKIDANNFSNYIVFVDESGNHVFSKKSTHHEFLYVFCIFRKCVYIREVGPDYKKAKFQTWGHDQVILHASQMRKRKGEFSPLQNPNVRRAFYRRIVPIFEASEFDLVASMALKRNFTNPPPTRHGLIEMTLRPGLERVFEFLESQGQQHNDTFFVFESRGRTENTETRNAFSRICNQGQNTLGRKLPFKMATKKSSANIIGLQVADLAANPMGRFARGTHVGDWSWPIVEKKFWGGLQGGLITLP